MTDLFESNYTESDKKEDTKILHSMGYAQELERRMPVFSNFAISFSIICILSGGINSLAQATAGAGGASIGIGWPIGCLISGVFALAMGQIASSYPTAGGLYHWSSILGNRFTGWLTAWLNLLGLITVLGAINVGTWGFFSGAIAPWFPAINVDTTVAEGFRNQIIFMALITGLQALINHFGIRLTARLTDFSGYLIFAATIVLTLACFAFAEHWDFTRLWTFDNFSGDPTLNAANELKGDPVWPNKVSGLMVFLLGLLLPIYTITGYDASAHTSEETHKAAMSAPHGMVSSVWWSAIFGYAMLIGFLVLIPDMKDAAKQGWNVFFWALDQRFSGMAERRVVCRDLRLAIPLRSGDGHFGFADDLRLRSRRWPAWFERPKKGQPCPPHARCGDLDGLDPRRSVCLGRFARHHCGSFGLHDRCLLHGHLPVLLVRDPDRFGATGLRQDLDEDGTVGSRRAPVQACRSSFDPVGDFDLFHRRSTPERLGALDHRRISHSDWHHMGGVRTTPFPGPADRRHDRQAPGRDRGGREGCRRSLTFIERASGGTAARRPPEFYRGFRVWRNTLLRFS